MWQLQSCGDKKMVQMLLNINEYENDIIEQQKKIWKLNKQDTILRLVREYKTR